MEHPVFRIGQLIGNDDGNTVGFFIQVNNSIANNFMLQNDFP